MLHLKCRPSEVEQNGTDSAVTRTYSSDQWHVIVGACAPLYVPTVEDKGLKLRVQCTPARYACPSHFGLGGQYTTGILGVCLQDWRQFGPEACVCSTGLAHRMLSYVAEIWTFMYLVLAMSLSRRCLHFSLPPLSYAP